MSDGPTTSELPIELFTAPLSEEERMRLTRFHESLEEELATFQLEREQMLRSQKLYAATMQTGEIVGLAGLRKPSLVEIFFMVVQQEHQGRGHGKRLMARLMADVKSSDVVMLSVRASNSPAYHLYKQFGFKTLGHRQGSAFMLYWNLAGMVLSPLIWAALLGKRLLARGS